MSDNARQKLIDLVARFGHELSEDPRRCEGLLRDVCFDQKKEILILVTAIKEGVPQELLRLQKSFPQKVLLDRCAQKLHETTGFMQELSNWAVTSWALALGVIQSEDASNKRLPPNSETLHELDLDFDCTVFIVPSLPSEISVSIDLKLRLIPEGFFIRGEGSLSHSVTLSKPFFLGVYPVTQQQYQKVMGKNPSFFQGSKEQHKKVTGKNSSFFHGSKSQYQKVMGKNPRHFHGSKVDVDRSSHPVEGDSSEEVVECNHPVDGVSWEDAVEFCKRLSMLPEEREAGRVYRLPTEAEWEYACRAGCNKVFSFGDSSELLDDYGWYDENSNRQTRPVGEKKANAWGLYDMHGNVWEWCSDWYGEYPKGKVGDPSGPREGTLRVSRGGCWSSQASHCRSAFRNWDTPSSRFGNLGFRVALSTSETPCYF